MGPPLGSASGAAGRRDRSTCTGGGDAALKYDRPIHELLRECAHELREPFTAAEVLRWFAGRYPDIASSAVRAHIQAMTGNAPNRLENHPYLGGLSPVLRRLSRGSYARWTGSTLSTYERSAAGEQAQAPAPSLSQPTEARLLTTVATDEWFWEGNVQAKLIAHLVEQGYDVVRVADTGSREAGTDVVARRDGRLLHVEVKGWPSHVYRDITKSHLVKPTSAATQARVWFNDGIVHTLRLRHAHPDDQVALCLPERTSYTNLLKGVASSLDRCAVQALLVREDGSVTPFASV